MAGSKRTRIPGAERRERIIDAARPLFEANGLAATRTRDIAKAADINEALIYQHFGSKEELFEAAVVAPLEAIVERLAVTGARSISDESGARQEAAVALFVRDVLGAMVESLSLFGIVLFSDLDSGREFYCTRIRPLLDELAAVIRANLDEWPHKEFDPDLAVSAGFGMCLGVALDSVYRGERLDVDAAATQLAQLLFGGVGR